MNWNGKTLLGGIFLFIGASMVLGMLGIHVGGLIGLLLALILCGYGIKAINKGHKVIGVVALIFGLLILSGSLPFLIGLAFAVVCIYFGWKMFNHKDDELTAVPAFSETYNNVDIDSSFEDEWKQFMKNIKEQ